MNCEEEKFTGVSCGDKQVEEDLWQRYKAERRIWTEPMLMALGKGVKGNKWFSLIDKMSADKTLQLGWEKVQDNAGGCGVDHITVERFAKDSQNRLLAIKEQLRKGSYQPKPIKRVWIDKPGSSEKRPLGIPTVSDRIVQTSLKMVIEPIFEKEFVDHSYGFRPGRGCKDALRRVERMLKAGNLFVVDVDIKGYFDNIPHELLMEQICKHIADGRILGLIEAFLKQGVIEETNWQEAKDEGTPQGGVISPLMANIYLTPLDKLLAERGYEMVRYADDIVVLCRTQAEATLVLEKIREWMKGSGLALHPEKTRVVDMNQAKSHFDFLGYRFKRSQRGEILRLVRPKSQRKLREAIKPQTRRTNGKSIEVIVSNVNRTLKGWYGYFKHAHPSELAGIDQWLRMRLRSILRKRRKGRGRGRGADHQRWPNRYFTGLGLFNLKEAQVLELISLRQEATH